MVVCIIYSPQWFYGLRVFIRVYLIIRRNNIILCWISLELNILRVLPLIGRSNSFFNMEESLKYFLVQSVASSQLLFSYLLNQVLRAYWVVLWLATILRVKLGAAPFHNWFIRVLKRIRLVIIFVLSTIQKLLPMYLLQFIPSRVVKGFILFRAGVSALGRFNQLLIRKLLAYSSVILVAWIIRGIFLKSLINWVNYWGVYTIRLAVLLGLIKNNFIRFQLISQVSIHYLTKFCRLIALLGLGGVPPFRLFFIKIIFIRSLIRGGLTIIRLVLLLFSLWIIYFYVRLGFSIFLRMNRQKCLNFSLRIKGNFIIMIRGGSYLILINYLHMSIII